MRKIIICVLIAFIVFCFCFNILGLMNLIPIYITSPLLFFSLLLLLNFLNGRNKFRGFKS
nr:hypothetical protein [Lederbergia citrisecunda]